MRRSPSRTRFYTWRMKCLQKSRSLDQTQLKDVSDKSRLEEANFKEQKLDKKSSSSTSKIKRDGSFHLQPPDVTAQTHYNQSTNRNSSSSIEVDLLKSLKRSRSPTPVPTSLSITPPKISLVLQTVIVPSSLEKLDPKLGGNLIVEPSSHIEDRLLNSEESEKYIEGSNEELMNKIDNEQGNVNDEITAKENSWLKSTLWFVLQIMSDVVMDFTVDEIETEDEVQYEEDGDNLSVKRMKENLFRFSTLFGVIMNFWARLQSVTKWTKPKSTALFVCCFIYCIVYDWWMSALVGYATLKLTITLIVTVDWSDVKLKSSKYLKEVLSSFVLSFFHWNTKSSISPNEKEKSETHIELSLTPTLPRTKSSSSNLEDILFSSKTALGLDKSTEKQIRKVSRPEETVKKEKSEGGEKVLSTKEKDDKLDKNDGLGEKIVFVLQVARRAQNWLGMAADYADKIQAILKWEDEWSSYIYFFLIALLAVSILLPPGLIFKISATGIVLKYCCYDGFLVRYTKLKKKIFERWNDWKNMEKDLGIDILSSQFNSPTYEFIEAFDLPAAEYPVNGWSNGRRCTLVNRDRSLASGFKNGRLYLTPSYICFERSRTSKEKNIKIPLKDVESILKAESYSWIPGGGMAIEICLKSSEQSPDFSKPNFFLDSSDNLENNFTVTENPEQNLTHEDDSKADNEFDNIDTFDNLLEEDVEDITPADFLKKVENYEIGSRTPLAKKRKVKRTKNKSKSFFFGGIRNRDDVYESLVQAIKNLHSASETPRNIESNQDQL